MESGFVSTDSPAKLGLARDVSVRARDFIGGPDSHQAGW